jgi:hypothetical protein
MMSLRMRKQTGAAIRHLTPRSENDSAHAPPWEFAK